MVFFFKPNTAYELRISDLSSDVCSSDLFSQPCMTATIMSIRSRLAKRLLRTHLLDWWQGQPHRVFPLRCHLRLAAKASSRESFLYMVPANTSWSQGPQSRSEEHTSELQSLMRISYAVFCLKKKK